MRKVLRQGRGAPGAHQHFEHRIQRGRVRAARLDDRFDVFARRAEELRGHFDLMVLHPIGVAFQRIDLAVMRQHAEGLRQPPSRECVSRIALMEDRKGRNEPFVLQVGIEVGELFRQEHALVDQRARRQRANIEILDGGGANAFLDAPPAEIKPAVQRFEIFAVARVEHDLLDFRARGVGFLADDRDIHRHLAPAIEIKARAQDLGFDNGAASFLRHVIRTRQENLPHRDTAGTQFMAGLFDLCPKEILRHRNMDSGAIAGFAVCIDGPAMPDRFQRLDRAHHDFAPRLAVDGRDQADAAGVMFLIGGVSVVLFKQFRVGDEAGNFGCGGFFRHLAPHPERYALRPPRVGGGERDNHENFPPPTRGGKTCERTRACRGGGMYRYKTRRHHRHSAACGTSALVWI